MTVEQRLRGARETVALDAEPVQGRQRHRAEDNPKGLVVGRLDSNHHNEDRAQPTDHGQNEQGQDQGQVPGWVCSLLPAILVWQHITSCCADRRPG